MLLGDPESGNEVFGSDARRANPTRIRVNRVFGTHRASSSNHIFRHGGLGDIKAKLQQLAMNTGRTPKEGSPCTYGGRDHVSPHRSSGAHRDCGTSSAKRRESPCGASGRWSLAVQLSCWSGHQENVDIARQTAPDPHPSVSASQASGGWRY